MLNEVIILFINRPSPDPRPHSGREEQFAEPLAHCCLAAAAEHRAAGAQAHAGGRCCVAGAESVAAAAHQRYVHAASGRRRSACMPPAPPAFSAAKAAHLLQQTDRLIKSVPDLLSMYGTQVIAAQPLHRTALQLRARGESPPVLISAQTASASTAGLQSAQRSARARHRWAPH